MKKYLNTHCDANKWADVLDELPFWSAPFGLKLLDYIDYKPNISALDIGFGTGFPLTEIAMRLGESSTVYGIDPWRKAIEKARKKADFYQINNIQFIEGVAENIPLENNSIDLITSNNGINNVSDIDKALSECSRIMKQGGQFVQTMNTDKTMIEFYDALEGILSELNMSAEIDAMRQHIAKKRPPVTDFVATLNKHGFEVKNLKEEQFNYKFVDGTTMLNHYFIRLAFMESWINLLPKDKVEDIFDRIEALLNKQAKSQGALNLSVPFVLIDAIKK